MTPLLGMSASPFAASPLLGMAASPLLAASPAYQWPATPDFTPLLNPAEMEPMRIPLQSLEQAVQIPESSSAESFVEFSEQAQWDLCAAYMQQWQGFSSWNENVLWAGDPSLGGVFAACPEASHEEAFAGPGVSLLAGLATMHSSTLAEDVNAITEVASTSWADVVEECAEHAPHPIRGQHYEETIQPAQKILPMSKEIVDSGNWNGASRTTVMLRNMPNNQTRKMFMELLDREGFAKQYDFV